MARQQRVSNERRKELEELDPFQENLLKAIEYVKAYKKQLILVGIGFIAVIAIFSIVILNLRSSEKNAYLLLDKTLADYNKIQDPQKGFQTIENDFSKLFEDYSNTSAGKIAKIKFAKICYKAAQYEKAELFYKKALSDYDNDPAMETIINSALGHTCIARGKFEEAKNYFLKITQKTEVLSKDEALFNLGMIAEKNNDKKTSQDFYKKIVSDFPASMYKALAQNKLKI